LEPHQWVAVVSYRYFHSFRDFKGDEEVHIPAAENDTYVDAFDVSATYAITKRLSLTFHFNMEAGQTRVSMTEFMSTPCGLPAWET
jgi:hypothetical protein